MSFVPSNPSNINPQLSGYTNQGKFRFWCQMALPMVYDDSLSYYELLNKMVVYLNNVISDVGNMETNIEELNNDFLALQNYVNTNYGLLVDYVNTYFDNLDVQEEINTKLDNMADEGVLTTLLSQIYGAYTPPVFVDNTSAMTDPLKTYVLTSTGYIYTYNGTEFVSTGLQYSFDSSTYNHVVGVLADNTDLDTIRTNSTYLLAGGRTYPNRPINTTGMLYTVKISDVAIVQYFVKYGDGTTYYRYHETPSSESDTGWRAWEYTVPDSYLKVSGTLPANTDFNDATDNEIYIVPPNGENNTYANRPANVYGILTTYGFDNAKTQTFKEFYSGKIHYRYKTSENWGAWVNDNFFRMMGTLATNTDLNDVGDNACYLLLSNRTYTNAPTSDHYGVLYSVDITQYAKTQFFVDYNTGKTFYRKHTSGGWGNWLDVADSNPELYHVSGLLPSNTDLNTVTENGCFLLLSNRTYTNTPPNMGYGELFTTYITEAAQTQIFIDYITGKMFYRYHIQEGWQNWIDVTAIPDEVFRNGGILPTNSNLNSVLENGFCLTLASYTYTNHPNDESGILYTFNVSNAAKAQYFVTYHANKTYYRYYSQNAWTEWKLIAGVTDGHRPAKMFAFGASLMKGAIWVDNPSAPSGRDIVFLDEQYQYPTKIAMACGCYDTFINAAEGGLAYVAFSGYTHNGVMMDVIKRYGGEIGDDSNNQLADAELIILGGGRNDSPNQLGDADTATSNDGTICGAFIQIFDYLAVKAPKAQIVVIQATPRYDPNSQYDIFHTAFGGGWDMEEYKEEVGKIAAKYYSPIVGWEECSYVKHWQEFSGAGGNWAHCNNAESMLQLANYIAGKVSQYYRN